MNFLTMDYFLAAAQEKNFTRAAGRLHITQQTLSAHIAALEQELGCRLFERTKPLRLTYEGERFSQYAQEFVPLYRSLQQEFEDMRAQTRGRLCLGITHTRGRVLLPDILTEYRRLYPGVEVDIREGQNLELLDGLKKGHVDLIIAVPRTETPEIDWEDFYWEDILLLGNRDLITQCLHQPPEALQAQITRQGSLAPLKNCPFLLGRPGDINSDLGRLLLRQSGFVPLVGARAENIETLLELCLRGGGLCFCPNILALRLLTPAQQQSLFFFSLGEQARYPLRFGSLKCRYRPREVRDFIALCRTLRPLG